ncbi:hypothetical protein UF75_2154 [Desulfosporosinus sp. I2]|nr:hypothetical protein UF75_2154 [Desulfosporosinus sp. I2]
MEVVVEKSNCTGCLTCVEYCMKSIIKSSQGEHKLKDEWYLSGHMY